MKHPEDQGVATLAAALGAPVTVLRPCLRGDGPGPGTPYDWDGVVVMGSAASALDAYPWLEDLRAWLAPVVAGAQPLPLLGICFGHQLVAHEALGRAPDAVGFVREDHAKLVGIASTRLHGSRIAPGDRTIRSLISHREEVKRLPPGFRMVGTRAGVLYDALEHEERPILTVQYHPEAREDFAAERGLDAAAVDAALREGTMGLLRSFMRLVNPAGGAA